MNLGAQVGREEVSEGLSWDPYLVGFNERKPKGKFTLMNDSLSIIMGSKWEWQGQSMSLREKGDLWSG